jgi:SAM-dependent methyltransferase
LDGTHRWGFEVKSPRLPANAAGDRHPPDAILGTNASRAGEYTPFRYHLLEGLQGLMPTHERQVTRTSDAAAGLAKASCRFCGAELRRRFVDLGLSPLCQKHVHPDELNDPEVFYPLCAYICTECFLVQLGEFVAPEEIFGYYHYFSSHSDTWLAHARSYTDAMVERFKLHDKSLVAEIASNDGYLLQYFVARGIPSFGIEPAANVAKAAQEKGIDTVVCFFGSGTARSLAAQRGRPDLLVGNNVLAHVPDLNDFVAGITEFLAPHGVVTMEFPHLMRLVEQNQFDTIYHEHFSYFSFTTVERVFASHGLTLFDVEEVPTHGGSLRIYGRHADWSPEPVTNRIAELRQREAAAGMLSLDYYTAFGDRVMETKRRLLTFLINAAESGKTVVGYGAPGKGNTLLNYCGIRTDLMQYTVDRSPVKQGTYLPGTRIPVYAPERILDTRPDYVLILPWNLKDEVIEQMASIRAWGGRFVIPIPEVTIC